MKYYQLAESIKEIETWMERDVEAYVTQKFNNILSENVSVVEVLMNFETDDQFPVK